MFSSGQKMADLILVKYIVLLLLLQSVLLSSAESSPPEQPEWEANPDIFSSWPKADMDQTKSLVKSPSIGTLQAYLPGTTRPIKYLLKLLVILESDIESEELKAPGSVRIVTKCVQATDEIVLHANTKYLTIMEDSVKVSEAVLGLPGRQISIINQTFDTDTDFYIIRLSSPCTVRKEYIVDINFVAEIASDTLTGLYLSTYTDPLTNISKRLATTQLEAEHARQMFPHYDQPDHKATFSLIIGRHANYSSMSNMNMIKTEEDNDRHNWHWDHYAPTPVMSSYLVAVIVSDFICEPAPPPGYKKHVETCGPPYMIQRGGGVHAAEVVSTILNFYDDFMKQEYPLPKMTSVAIPDFQAGAMENWGLNTYRIKGIIYYPNITSEESRFRIDLTIAHELAHQNWGNLVTTKHWNQIWLNEGFATYISYFGLKISSPEFDPDKQWMTSYRRRALQIDGSNKTHPLVNATSPMFYFDGISYSKGASLLKMMENFLSPKVFHEALRLYLVKYAYSSATQWDLFDVIERHAIVSGANPKIASITEIMESWTLQPGYPLIRVEYMTNRAVLVTQERYTDKPSDKTFPPTRWYIPITIAHNNVVSKPSVWLSGREPAKVIYTEEDFTWIVINPDASAFARVLYDDYTAALIENQLNTAHEVISAITRAQIIEDAFETAWAGYGQIDAALNYTRYLGNELEPIVWSSALTGLGKIYAMLADDTTAIVQFKKYVYDRISSSLARIGVQQGYTEKGIAVLHRGSLLHWAGLLEIPEALTHAISKIQHWADSSINSIPPDLHSQTYCNAIIGGERKTYDQLLDFLHKETDADVKHAIAKSLGCSKDEIILSELRFNLTKESSALSPPYNFELMFKLARNGLTRKDILQYFDENFYAIQDRFEGVFVIAKSLEIASQYWNTREQLEQVQNFLTKYAEDLEEFEKTSKRIIRNVQNNISWMERFSSAVKDWLIRNN